VNAGRVGIYKERAFLQDEGPAKGASLHRHGIHHDYRVLRMSEMPKVAVHLVPSTAEPGGIGETGTSCFTPPLTNAIFAATGKRIRKLPVGNSSPRERSYS
jgi:CO/xanthine dehydrogenase Mo-binding subunit